MTIRLIVRSFITAALGRFDRSRGRSIESIGSVGSVILRIFQFFCHVGELEICLVSKFQLCTTLGDRKIVEKPKHKFSEFFGSVGLVFRSVRSNIGSEDRGGRLCSVQIDQKGMVYIERYVTLPRHPKLQQSV